MVWEYLCQTIWQTACTKLFLIIFVVVGFIYLFIYFDLYGYFPGCWVLNYQITKECFILN